MLDENKLYTVDELARLTGLDVENVWRQLEDGDLSALAYADDGDAAWFGWRVIPPDGVKAARAGTHDLIEWQSATGRLTAKCDVHGIRVQLLDVDVETLRRPRTRMINLHRAIFAAWDAGLPIESSASVILDYLNTHDRTGFVVRAVDNVVVWRSDGKTLETQKKSVENALKSLRERYLSRPRPVA